MRKPAVILFAVIATLSLACSFSFTPDSISGKLGDVVTITIKVEKTHLFCVMPGTSGYKLEFEGVQLIESSGWKKVNSRTYEITLKLSLARVGDGYVKISKRCSKGGYQEGVLKIKITEDKTLLTYAEKQMIPPKLGIKEKDFEVIETTIAGDTDWIEVKEIAGLKLEEPVVLKKGEKVYLYVKDHRVFLLISRSSLYRFDSQAVDRK